MPPKKAIPPEKIGSTRDVVWGTDTVTLTKKQAQVSQVLAVLSEKLSELFPQDKLLFNLAAQLKKGSREILSVDEKKILNGALQKCLSLAKEGKNKAALSTLDQICSRMFGKGFSDTGQFLAAALAALFSADDPSIIYTACTSDTAAAIGLLLPPFSVFCRKNGKSWDKYFMLIDIQIAKYLTLHGARLKDNGERVYNQIISQQILGRGTKLDSYTTIIDPTQALNKILIDMRDKKQTLQRYALMNDLETSEIILRMNEMQLINFFKDKIRERGAEVPDEVSDLETLYMLCENIKEEIFRNDMIYDPTNAYDEAAIDRDFDVPIWVLELFISKYKSEIYKKKSEEDLKRQALRAAIMDFLKGHDFGLNMVLIVKNRYQNLFSDEEWAFLEAINQGSTEPPTGDDIVLGFADQFIGSACCLINSQDVMKTGILRCKFNSLKSYIYDEQITGPTDISSQSDGNIFSCIPGVNTVVVSQDFTSTKTFGEDTHAHQLQYVINLIKKYFFNTAPLNQSWNDFIEKNKNKILRWLLQLKSPEEDFDSAAISLRMGMHLPPRVNTSISLNIGRSPPLNLSVSTKGPPSYLPDPLDVYLKMVFNNMHKSIIPEDWRVGIKNIEQGSDDNIIWLLACVEQLVLNTKNDAISGLSVVKQKNLLKQIVKNAEISISDVKKGKGKGNQPDESPFDIYFKDWEKDPKASSVIEKLKNYIVDRVSRLTEDEIKDHPNELLLDIINRIIDVVNIAIKNDLVNHRSDTNDCLSIRESQTSEDAFKPSVQLQPTENLRLSAANSSRSSMQPQLSRNRSTSEADARPRCDPSKTLTTGILGFLFTSIIDGMPSKEDALITQKNRKTPEITSNDEKLKNVYLERMKESGITNDTLNLAFGKTRENLIRALESVSPEINYELNIILASSNLLLPFKENILNIIYDIKNLLPKKGASRDVIIETLLTIIHDDNNVEQMEEIYKALGISFNSTREVVLIVWLLNLFYPDLDLNNTALELLSKLNTSNVERVGFIGIPEVDNEVNKIISFLSDNIKKRLEKKNGDDRGIDDYIDGLLDTVFSNRYDSVFTTFMREIGCSRHEDIAACMYKYYNLEQRRFLTSGQYVPSMSSSLFAPVATGFGNNSPRFEAAKSFNKPNLTIKTNFNQGSPRSPRGSPSKLKIDLSAIHSPRTLEVATGSSSEVSRGTPISSSSSPRSSQKGSPRYSEGNVRSKRSTPTTLDTNKAIKNTGWDTPKSQQNESTEDQQDPQNLQQGPQNLQQGLQQQNLQQQNLQQNLQQQNPRQGFQQGFQNQIGKVGNFFGSLFKNNNRGGRPFTRGRKQKVKQFTKARKLRKGTRKSYRKKNKTRRQ